jgi:toxin ParE1/3/4
VKRLGYAPEARADLAAIAVFIGRDNPDRATTLVAELEARAAKAAERPQSFPARNDISPGLRSVAHGSYRILFRELADSASLLTKFGSSASCTRSAI